MRAISVLGPVVGGIVGLGVIGLGVQPEGRGPQTPPGKPGETPLAGLGFLAGTWSGLMEGDPVEETWSAPAGDSIIGMFRWQHEGRTTMWELLSIRAEDGASVLRLRHFGADLTPWKGECDALASCKATTIEKHRVVFTNRTAIGGLAACEYERTPKDTLRVTVSFKPETGREALKFELARVK